MATTTASPREPTRPRPEPKYQWFTTCPQEWFIVVVRGGDLHKIIHSVDGWYVDENLEFQREVRGDPRRTNTVSLLRALSGYDFVGIPGFQGMLVYKFSWNKFWRKVEGGQESPEYVVQAHASEDVYITPFEAQYPLKFGGIEVLSEENKVPGKKKALIPITITVTVRVRMRAPRIALQTNTDWFGQVLTPNIQKAIKEFAGDKYYDWMIREAKAEGSRQFSAEFMQSGTALNQFSSKIRSNAGLEIIDIGITDIEPNKKFEDALLEQAVAEVAARAAITKAEGEKQVKILQGQAEQAYAELVGKGNAARILAEAAAEFERIRQTSIYAAGGPGEVAASLEKWRQIHGSGLSAYFESGSKGTGSILVGSNGKPISSP